MLLGSLNATLTHYVNVETIGCEAIVSDDSATPFDSLQWFDSYDSTPLPLLEPMQRSRVDARTLNYSIEFPANSRLVRNNTNYKCCTLLAARIQHCQQFIAIIRRVGAPPLLVGNSTTRPTRPTLKKMKKIDTNIFAWPPANDLSGNSSSNLTNQMFSALFRFCK